jgi:transporter family-2 protein
MYKYLAILNGLLISIMVLLNGTLATATGLYFSLFIINSLCLIIVILIIVIKKIPIKDVLFLPKYLYFVGVIGLVNITLNNISFINLGATLTMGLVLYGQLLASVIVDFGGLFGLAKQPFRPKKLIGIIIMSLGILIMILY